MFCPERATRICPGRFRAVYECDQIASLSPGHGQRLLIVCKRCATVTFGLAAVAPPAAAVDKYASVEGGYYPDSRASRSVGVESVLDLICCRGVYG